MNILNTYYALGQDINEVISEMQKIPELNTEIVNLKATTSEMTIIIDRLTKALADCEDRETPPEGIHPLDIHIDGVRMTPTPLNDFISHTGTWAVDYLGEVEEGAVYTHRLRGRPDHLFLMIVRHPDGDGQIETFSWDVAVAGYPAFQITTFPGAAGVWETVEPVEPTIARIVEAVETGYMLPYSPKAFDGWPRKPAWAVDLTSQAKLGHDPARIYGYSSSNSVFPWTISGAGGEYSTSRGFISGEDAFMIAAALEGDETVFKQSAQENRLLSLYGLGIPNHVIWSFQHHKIRDPQIPFDGDRPWKNEGRPWTRGDDYGNEGTWVADADEPNTTATGAKPGTAYKHTRDQAHLFNHGLAYWLATGHPAAALLINATQAYSLASHYLGADKDGTYRSRFNGQRTTLNQFNALWAMKTVIDLGTGGLIWFSERVEKQNSDLWNDWNSNIAAMDSSSDIYEKASSIFRGIDNGVGKTDFHWSVFMMQGYGPEVAYLFALERRYPQLMRRIAENMVLRFGRIGGTRGYYGLGSGSGFRLIARDGTRPYDDAEGLISWTNQDNPYPADTFDGAPYHYVMRAYHSLQLAKAASVEVEGLDAAISKMEAARDATTKWASTGVIGWKHAGIAHGFEGVGA